MRNKDGFTLMELLIVMGLIAILAVAALIALNPLGQIQKANDAKRKGDLNQLKKVLEDYYNDKQYYPPPSSMCNDTPAPLYSGAARKENLRGYTCHVCGKSLSPYLSNLPCDPQHPGHDYIYYTDSDTSPTWYRIYSDLQAALDKDSDREDCAGGACGLPNGGCLATGGLFDSSGHCVTPFGYDYGVSSPNVDLDRSNKVICLSTGSNNIPACNQCQKKDGDTSNMSTYEYCLTQDAGCIAGGSKLYSTTEACKAANPNAQ